MSQNAQNGRSRGKGVPEYLRIYLQTQMAVWLAAAPKRKAKDLAKLAGLTEAQISTAKNHGRGIGYDTFKGMARVLGITGDELEQRALAAWNQRPADLRVVRDGDFLKNGDMPGWADAETAARIQMDGVPGWVFDQARGRTGLIPRDGVTTQYVIDEALEIFRYATPAQVLEQTSAELDRRVSELRRPKRKKR